MERGEEGEENGGSGEGTPIHYSFKSLVGKSSRVMCVRGVPAHADVAAADVNEGLGRCAMLRKGCRGTGRGIRQREGARQGAVQVDDKGAPTRRIGCRHGSRCGES